jgi:hypothetical protein
MCNKIVFMDELASARPRVKRAAYQIILSRPTVGKSKALKKALKKLNKERRKQGLKKIKVKNFKLKVPEGWKPMVPQHLANRMAPVNVDTKPKAWAKWGKDNA